MNLLFLWQNTFSYRNTLFEITELLHKDLLENKHIYNKQKQVENGKQDKEI